MGIRRATADDFPPWAAMRLSLYTDVRAKDNEAQMQDLMADPAQECMVAEDEGGALLGFIELSERRWAEGCMTSPVGYVEGWFVAPAARRKGVGRALMEAAAAWSRSRGHSEIGSDADVTNAGSIAAHARLGFAEAERTVQFFRRL
jgi:aminoglycoside 6'-N-acetyltransferase I